MAQSKHKIAPTGSQGLPSDFDRFVYPFFMIHMLAFGLSGFFLAYGSGHADGGARRDDREGPGTRNRTVQAG